MSSIFIIEHVPYLCLKNGQNINQKFIISLFWWFRYLLYSPSFFSPYFGWIFFKGFICVNKSYMTFFFIKNIHKNHLLIFICSIFYKFNKMNLQFPDHQSRNFTIEFFLRKNFVCFFVNLNYINYLSLI